MTSHTLKHLQDILLLHKRHLTVDLSKLRLTVSTKILIAETLTYLEITIQSSHHTELFQRLRTLRKSIELPWIHTAGHDKVASPLGSGVDQYRSLNLHKTLSVEIAAHLESKLMSQFEIFTHHRASQIQIAILHTDIITAIALLLNRKRRSKRLIDDIELLHYNLNITRREVLVFRITLSHHTCSLNDIFASKSGSSLLELIARLLIESKLSDTISVTQIYKRQGAEIVNALHPPGESDRLALISESQLATCLTTIHYI